MALLLVVARLRCQQMDRESERGLAAGFAAVSDSLLAGQARWDEAERGFQVAAREALGDPWPLFCLSAVAELRAGGRDDPGWREAFDHLLAGRLAEARTAFGELAEVVGSGQDAERAARYVRFVDALAAAR